MTGLISLDPHQTSLVVLDTHGTLRTVDSSASVLGKDIRELKIGYGDVDRGGWLGLKAELTVPGHVLNREQSSVARRLSVADLQTAQHGHVETHVMMIMS